MESQLAAHLSACAEAFRKATGRELSTIGRLIAGDWRFFTDLGDGRKTFTARKYDEVMCRFSDNWPEGTAWPKKVPRPSKSTASAA